MLAVTAIGALAGCGGSAHADGTGPSKAIAAADRFLHSYVAPDGAVIRRDQGGDTVSEGQGYALLLSYATGNRKLFARIWSWTRRNLQQPDGLFAYHWQDGAVVSSEPAADADTQIAWALSLAGETWSIPADTTAARRVAEAIAANEIGYDDHGRPTLAAGPWAIAPGRPVQVEPGYWTYPADTALAALTGDHRWRALAAADAAHLEALTADGHTLPPDWATLGDGSGPRPSVAPQDGAAVTSGQDGLRALAWSACLPSTRSLDAKWWKLIAPTARSGPLSRNVDGSPAASGPSPLSLVAAAAAASAAGHPSTMNTLLAKADHAATTTPTYYGQAWDALGRLLLSTKTITDCTG